MPQRPDHPDREALAAAHAGFADGREQARLEAHLAGCEACRSVVAALEEVRRRLAAMPEPELPPGLSQRLAAAVAAEQHRLAPPRRPAWYRRPSSWVAAAALLLAVAGVSNLALRPHRAATTSAATAEGAAQAPRAATQAPAPGRVPVVAVGGEYSSGQLAQVLQSNPAARLALGGTGPAAPATQSNGSTGAAADGSKVTPVPGVTTSGGQPGTASPGGSVPDQAACIARVSRTGQEPQQPALFLTGGSYQGRPATALVMRVGNPPRLARMYIFPAGDCSHDPIAVQQSPLHG